MEALLDVLAASVAVGIGALLYWAVRLEDRRAAEEAARTSSGWVYFLSPIGGDDREPPAPIKIGMTHRDPAKERLPEIETMSPEPLELIAILQSQQPELLELTIHRELKPFRRHGEWFDRDATLAWLSEIQGALQAP